MIILRFEAQRGKKKQKIELLDFMKELFNKIPEEERTEDQETILEMNDNDLDARKSK